MSAKYKKCPFCKNKAKPSAVFCIYCGKDFRNISFVENNGILIADMQTEHATLQPQTDTITPIPVKQNSEDIVISEKNISVINEPVAIPKSVVEPTPIVVPEPVVEPTPIVAPDNITENEPAIIGRKERRNPFQVFAKNKEERNITVDNTKTGISSTDIPTSLPELPIVKETSVKENTTEEISSTTENNVGVTEYKQEVKKPQPFTLNLNVPSDKNTSVYKPVTEEPIKPIVEEHPVSVVDNKEPIVAKAMASAVPNVFATAIPQSIPTPMPSPVEKPATQKTPAQEPPVVFKSEPQTPKLDETDDFMLDARETSNTVKNAQNGADLNQMNDFGRATYNQPLHSNENVIHSTDFVTRGDAIEKGEEYSQEEPEDIFFANEETIREQPYDAREDGYYEDVVAEIEEEIKHTMADSTKKTILAIALSIVVVIIYAFWKGYI